MTEQAWRTWTTAGCRPTLEGHSYAEPVTLRDEIFPSEQRQAYVQTEWSKGWDYAGSGYSEAARFLTEHRRSFGASIDQVGLVIFFLQRHRVELAMKDMLVRRRFDLREVKTQHSLVALWDACRRAVGGDTEEWRELDAGGSEIVALLADADPGSYTYRYPVGKDGTEHGRPRFIDLDALEDHVTAFVSLIDGYIAFVEEAEQDEREYWADAESRHLNWPHCRRFNWPHLSQTFG